MKRIIQDQGEKKMKDEGGIIISREGNWSRCREKEFEYLISLEAIKKKVKVWLIRVDSYYRIYKDQKGNAYQLIEKKGKRLREKEFNYLIGLETIREKGRLWLERMESYYRINENYSENYYLMSESQDICKIAYHKDHRNQRNKKGKRENGEDFHHIQGTSNILNLKEIPKIKEGESENRNNLIERNIVTLHYSCLEEHSLVQIQNLDLGLKNPSGLQRIFRDSSKA
jgi:hypothetical protein